MLSNLAGPVSQLLIPAMETHSALAWALSGTSAMFESLLPLPAFAIRVPHGASFACYSLQACTLD